jgi:undecaprenyl diphosphate synthase
MIGHRQGIKSIEKVLDAAKGTGVEILTLYTFSTENWKRPKKEIETLMNLLEEYLDTKYNKLNTDNIRLMTIGRVDRFRPSLREKIDKIKDLTKANSGLILNLALDYGGRDEITNASRRIIEDVKSGKIKEDDVCEELFSRYLYTGGLPDPDLLIRTGGEFRVSNFLLWQISYSELYVTKKLWPDFGKRDFKKAIATYKRRDRRLGG